MTMFEDSENIDLMDIIENCNNDEKLICEIKKRLKKKNNLVDFTRIRINMSDNKLPGNSERIFRELIKRKLIAQSMLNMYYNEYYSRNCSVITVELDDTTNDIRGDGFPNIDDVVTVIRAYIILFQILESIEVRNIEATSPTYNADEEEISFLGDGNVGPMVETGSLPAKLDSLEINVGTRITNVEASGIKWWMCHGCTYRNKLTNDKCDVCFTDNPLNSQISQEQFVGSDKSMYWMCSYCSFKNKLENESCEVCFENHDNVEYEYDKDLSKCKDLSWRCPQCNCDQPFDRYMCVTCNIYAPFFEDWVCKKCSSINDKYSGQCMVCDTKNNKMKLCSGCRKNYFDKYVGIGCDECQTSGKLSFNEYDVWENRNGKRRLLHWKCTYCGEHNRDSNCFKCKNMRYENRFIQCKCNWNNLPSKMMCGKCFWPLMSLSALIN